MVESLLQSQNSLEGDLAKTLGNLWDHCTPISSCDHTIHQAQLLRDRYAWSGEDCNLDRFIVFRSSTSGNHFGCWSRLWPWDSWSWIISTTPPPQRVNFQSSSENRKVFLQYLDSYVGKLRIMPKQGTFRPIITYNRINKSIGKWFPILDYKNSLSVKLEDAKVVLRHLKNRLFESEVGYSVFDNR